MTQTLIEKLEALPTCDVTNDGEEIWRDKNGRYVHYDDLRAIIEDARAEKQEPEQCAVCGHKTTYCSDCGTEVWRPKSILSGNADIVAELVKALEDARDDVLECLNHDLPNKGWERYDRRIELREKQIKTIDALLAKAKEMMG